jgi:hypothetical protein
MLHCTNLINKDDKLVFHSCLQHNLEKTWKIIEHAIHEIYNHKASGLSFEELYRNAYNMVLHKYGEKLYSGLVTTHLKEIAKMIKAAQGDLFLEELNRKWIEHLSLISKRPQSIKLD